MRKTIFSIMLAAFAVVGVANAQWAPAGDRIKTPWAEKIDPNNVLPEYPRPQMTRSDWKNLNGLWDYAIRNKGEERPTTFDGKILVPYAIESSLSGVMKNVSNEQELWYNTTFEVPRKWRGKDLILHFGAVDWKADVFVNDKFIGTHTNGYVPFSFNVTPFLKGSGKQKLTVRVWDPTDHGYQARGKQIHNPHGIWYTPVTGIWQTVWMEPVAKTHITNIKTIPNLDDKNWAVTVDVDNAKEDDMVEVAIMDGEELVAVERTAPGTKIIVKIEDPKLWSPDFPFLYDMKVSVVNNEKTVDEVGSYAAMRKISKKRDKKGIYRMELNNKPLFQFGLLDQGWWPDGLYTQPSDEALVFDIQKTLDLGYNMIRKHVKVEPARWYYYCDKMGMLVWQDMPSSSADKGGDARWDKNTFMGGKDAIRSEESKANYRKEWKEIMDYCMSFPSIVVWVSFNEAWGQFETEPVAKWTKEYDPSRLVNPASGGNHTQADDILDTHEYPNPGMVLYNGEKVNVLGEYGGIGYAIEGHTWVDSKNNWGYSGLKKDADELTEEYRRYADMLKEFIKVAYASAVYTQTTDVEVEVNGLITYDRKIVKVDEKKFKEINQSVINSMNE